MSNQLKIVLISIYSIILMVFVYQIFQFQLGGYDMSAMINLCQRLSDGERPNIDFISTFPLSLLFWIKLNFLFFKNSYEFLVYSSFTHFVTALFFITALTLQNERLKGYALWLIVLISSIPLIITNHIFHSSFSQLNGIIIVINLLNIILQKRIKPFNYAVFLLFVGLTLFSKQNVGILCIGIVALTIIVLYRLKLLTVKELLYSVIVFFISTACYVLLIHVVLEINFGSFITTFTSVLGRGKPSGEQIREVFVNNKINDALTLLSVAVSLLIFIFALSKKHDTSMRVYIWFNFAIQIIGLYAYLTDWDVKFNDYPLVAVSNVAVLFAVINTGYKVNLYAIITLGVFALAVYLGIERYRMKLVGYGQFYENDDHYVITEGYLKGLHCGKRLYNLNQELTQLKRSHIIKSSTFFGPRMEFGYSQYNVPSPLYMPIWWHPGSSYPLKDEKEVIDTFEKFHFGVLVFLKNDKTRVPQPIVNYINSYYTLDTEYPDLDVYFKK